MGKRLDYTGNRSSLQKVGTKKQKTGGIKKRRSHKGLKMT